MWGCGDKLDFFALFLEESRNGDQKLHDRDFNLINKNVFNFYWSHPMWGPVSCSVILSRGEQESAKSAWTEEQRVWGTHRDLFEWGFGVQCLRSCWCLRFCPAFAPVHSLRAKTRGKGCWENNFCSLQDSLGKHVRRGWRTSPVWAMRWLRLIFWKVKIEDPATPERPSSSAVKEKDQKIHVNYWDNSEKFLFSNLLLLNYINE